MRFLERFERVAPLIALAICLFEAGCGSPAAKAPDAGVDAAPDAAGVDAAPDVAATDVGASPDIAPADVASDKAASDGSQGDGGGDGASDPCRPPCWVKLLNGCVPEGACVYSLANYCYANGVKFITSSPGNAIQQTISKNGVLCATVDPGHDYSDPSGRVLGYLVPNLDGSSTLFCTGDAPETFPASCNVTCSSGTCMP